MHFASGYMCAHRQYNAGSMSSHIPIATPLHKATKVIHSQPYIHNYEEVSRPSLGVLSQLHVYIVAYIHKGAAPSRGWVVGRLWNPHPPWLASWLARPWKTTKIRSAPLYRLFSRMVCVWGWVCKGGGGRPPFKKPHTPSCLAFGTSHKDQEHKT